MENEEINVLTIEDLPYICRICLSRSNLQQFINYTNLIDLFQIISNIKVGSDDMFPESVCEKCVLKLTQISAFIELSKHTDAIIREVLAFNNIQEHNMDALSKMQKKPKSEEIVAVLTSKDDIDGVKLIFINQKSTTEEICVVGTNKRDISMEIVSEGKNDVTKEATIECDFCDETFSIGALKDSHLDLHFYENEINCAICGKQLTTKEHYFEHIKLHPSENSTHQNNDRCKKCLNTFKWKAHRRLLNSDPTCENCQILKEVTELPVSNIESVYQCGKCLEEFDSEDGLSLHEKIHEDVVKDTIFTCDQCFKTFDWYYKLKLHQKSHITNLSCTNCNKTFASKQKLEFHMRTHRCTTYKCTNCFTTFRCLTNYNNHLMRHADQKFQCNICLKSFKDKYYLKKHSIIHSGPPKHKCDICLRCFFTNAVLKKHQLTHVDERDKKFKCSQCFRLYASQSRLNKHVQETHIKVRFQCDVCPQSFTKRINLFNHRRRKHRSPDESTKEEVLDPQYEKCTICEKPLKTKSEYFIHVELHKPENIIECEQCFKRFDSRYKLSAHQRLHKSEFPDSCPICFKDFKYKHKLLIHLKSHSKEKPYGCTKCSKRFKHKHALVEHKTVHTNKTPFKCSICSKLFRLKSHLQKHMVFHEGPPKFMCEVCSKSFYSIGPLNKHRLIHVDEKDKQFKCDQCFKAFASMPKLTGHIKEMHGEPRFNCDTCLKTFKRKQNLLKHIKLFHKLKIESF